VSSRGEERPRRSFYSNSLDGTIPAALSALKLLQTLCVRPVPLLRSAFRVCKYPCEYRARTLPVPRARILAVPVYEYYASTRSSGPVQCGTA
jgi:hypothetical protein